MNWFISIACEQDNALFHFVAASVIGESQVYRDGDQDKTYIAFFINKENAIGKHTKLQVGNQKEIWTFDISKNKQKDQSCCYEFMYSKRSGQLSLMLLGQSAKGKEVLAKWNECAGLPIEEKAKETYKLIK